MKGKTFGAEYISWSSRLAMETLDIILIGAAETSSTPHIKPQQLGGLTLGSFSGILRPIVTMGGDRNDSRKPRYAPWKSRKGKCVGDPWWNTP